MRNKTGRGKEEDEEEETKAFLQLSGRQKWRGIVSGGRRGQQQATSGHNRGDVPSTCFRVKSLFLHLERFLLLFPSQELCPKSTRRASCVRSAPTKGFNLKRRVSRGCCTNGVPGKCCTSFHTTSQEKLADLLRKHAAVAGDEHEHPQRA